MKKRNEVTSKKVASAASWLMKYTLGWIARDLESLGATSTASHLRDYEKSARKVAASALTQTPDKPKKRKRK